MKKRYMLTAIAFVMALLISPVEGQTQSAEKKSVAPAAASTPVTGSGTVGRLGKWTGADSSNSFTLGNSILFEDKFGKVGIGTTTPTSTLTVVGMIATTLGGYKFPDGTVQATAGLASVFHNATLTGNGTAASPLGVAIPLNLTGSAAGEANAILRVENTGVAGVGLSALGGASGTGMQAQGGANNNDPGGVGLAALGGVGNNSFGGTGVVAGGGNATLSGGIGLFVFGGSSFGFGPGGQGVVARGGEGAGDGGGGHGVVAAGGGGGDSKPGEGVVATGGNYGGSNNAISGGAGVLATGGTGKFAGVGVQAKGGTGTLNNTTGGTGVFGTGGNANGGVSGGTGVRGLGGTSSAGLGGTGVSAAGGGGNLFGGFGLDASGGRSDGGDGGPGIRSFGGDGGFSGIAIGNGGQGIIAVGGEANGAGKTGGDGLVARGGQGMDGATPGRAGVFNGDVQINGALNVTGPKNFKIDHPLNPANQYLYHAAIESSEILNVYSGNVKTNKKGEAVVTLPAWFEALNTDFRYQLTVIGQFAQAIVAEKIKDHQFRIKTNAANVEVSWQVTGIRSDAATRQLTFKVEEEKPVHERGTYLNPEAYGEPKEKGIQWARNPERMDERQPAHAKQPEVSKPKAQGRDR